MTKYSEQEIQEFSQKYFPVIFTTNSFMKGKYDEKHIRAYNNWASYAMDIVHERWDSYRSVKHDLDQAEEVYNRMMGADLDEILCEKMSSILYN